MLRGTIDDRLQMALTLTTADLGELEQKYALYGTMRRPKSTRDRKPQEDDGDDNPFASEKSTRKYVKQAPKQKPKKQPPEEKPVTHVDVPLSLYVKTIFRISGNSPSSAYDCKNTYEVEITPQQIKDILQRGKVEYRDRLPCNALTISLKDYVAPAAPAA